MDIRNGRKADDRDCKVRQLPQKKNRKKKLPGPFYRYSAESDIFIWNVKGGSCRAKKEPARGELAATARGVKQMAAT